ncbi:MAG TPA: hypothetical protein VL307_13980, partial [Chitinophagaceae bacterium]|nr:hypothetical protein [Chitinophagaceae bacterium]
SLPASPPTMAAPAGTPAAPAVPTVPANKNTVPAPPPPAAMYIVNGIVMGEGFDAKKIPANTIASINILKGDRATFLFGAKAKAGVVMISTKLHTTLVDSNTVIKDNMKLPE